MDNSRLAVFIRLIDQMNMACEPYQLRMKFTTETELRDACLKCLDKGMTFKVNSDESITVGALS